MLHRFPKSKLGKIHELGLALGSLYKSVQKIIILGSFVKLAVLHRILGKNPMLLKPAVFFQRRSIKCKYYLSNYKIVEKASILFNFDSFGTYFHYWRNFTAFLAEFFLSYFLGRQNGRFWVKIWRIPVQFIWSPWSLLGK